MSAPNSVAAPPEQRQRLEALFAQARQVMNANYEAFSALSARAHRLEHRGNVTDAVVMARIAADFASTNHPGLYVSPDLEALLQRAGRKLRRARRQRPRTGKTQRMHVLHVLTAAYEIGGHTRLLWRWIERDSGRKHSVVLTHQRRLRLPGPLRASVTASGGTCYTLDARPSGLFQKAQQLAELSLEADLVILHTHPYDVVPLLAFPASDPEATPVALLNQGDHIFWLSRSVARLVIDLRHSASDLGASRRGIPAANTALLPIPLQPPRRTLARAEAKRQLGLAQTEKVIFSVAAPYKYTPLGELDFAGIFAEFAGTQGVTVLVVGPERDARWRQAEDASNGRVRALGRRADLSLFHQAADIYVDSFPFGSATSLLEAGSYGVPVLSFSPVPGASVMTLDDPALDPQESTRTSLAGYQATLSALLEDEQMRGRVGQETATRITDMHVGESWSALLEALYSRALEAPPMPPLEQPLSEAHTPDLLLTSLGLISGISRTPEQVFTEHMQLLPLGSRIAQVLAGRERPGRLLSDWLGQQYEQLRGKSQPPISG